MRFVIRHPRYWLLGGGIAAALFLGLVWMPNVPIWLTLLSNAASLPGGIRVSVTLFGLAFSDSSLLLTGFYIVLSALTGTTIALLAYYWRTRRLIASGGAATGVLGAFVAVLGFGCASCGTLFISVLATSIGGASLATVPLVGDLVWLLRGAGLALLSFSVVRLVRHVNDPLVCPIE